MFKSDAGCCLLLDCRNNDSVNYVASVQKRMRASVKENIKFWVYFTNSSSVFYSQVSEFKLWVSHQDHLTSMSDVERYCQLKVFVFAPASSYCHYQCYYYYYLALKSHKFLQEDNRVWELLSGTEWSDVSKMRSGSRWKVAGCDTQGRVFTQSLFSRNDAFLTRKERPAAV